jgi:hypothetical protein
LIGLPDGRGNIGQHGSQLRLDLTLRCLDTLFIQLHVRIVIDGSRQGAPQRQRQCRQGFPRCLNDRLARRPAHACGHKRHDPHEAENSPHRSHVFHLMWTTLLHRMFKPHTQQGRSERRGEAYSFPYVEPLSEARTKLAGGFNILLPLSHAFLNGLQQGTEEIFDHTTLACLDLHRHRHAGRQIHLPPLHLDS